MYDLLHDLTVVEGASFIAGPSCALHLAQMGARVIRFDMIGGGPDYYRWPHNARGDSLYWEGLNKGKLSVALDLRRPEGRELAVALVTASGEGRGPLRHEFSGRWISVACRAGRAAAGPDHACECRAGAMAETEWTTASTPLSAYPFMTGPEELPAD